MNTNTYAASTSASSIYQSYILVPQSALTEIQDSYPPIACKRLRRDTCLLRMRGFNEAIAAKLIAAETIVGLERIASRDNDTATALLFGDPTMAYTQTKPDIAKYCADFAKELGGDSVIFHRDHHAYDGGLAPLTWPVKRRFLHKYVRLQVPYDLPWATFYGVFFERDPALAMLVAGLSGELCLHDVAHLAGRVSVECFALYDALKPAGGYRGNHRAQKAYLAAVDGVVRS